MQELLEFAEKTARKAGNQLMKSFGNVRGEDFKTADSIVTEADLAAENLIRRAITRNYPDHRIFGEEEGLDRGGAEFTWVLDPIDGTTNFARGVPLFGVSIALFQHRKPVAGVIYDPVRKACYTAGKDQPSACNGLPIHVSSRGLGPTTICAFGTNWEQPGRKSIPQRIIQRFKGRNFGSSVLHLVWVADGSLEFNLAENLKLWDIAAAGFIVVQAGGRMTTLDGKAFFPLKHDFEYYAEHQVDYLASNGKVHRNVLKDIVASS